MNRRTLRLAVAVLLVSAGSAAVALADSPTVAASARADTNGTAALVYTGDAITVEAEPRQAIRGESSLPAGTELTLRFQSTGDTEPRFLMTEAVRVSEDGTFTAYVDFAAQSAGDTFSVRVRHDGDDPDTVDGEVVASDGETPDATGTPVPTTEWPTPTPAADTGTAPYRFVDFSLTPHQGEKTRFVVKIPNGSTATVFVGDELDSGYETGIAVHDGDDDGSVALVLDTAAAGDDRPTLTVDSADDEVAYRFDETNLTDPLDTGAYDLLLYEGITAEGNASAMGTVVVLEPPSETATPTVTESPTPDPTTTTPTLTAEPTATERPGRGGVPDEVVGVGALLGGALLGGLGALLLTGTLRP